MGHSILLESFDDSSMSKAKNHPEFQNGFDEGYAACLSECEMARKSSNAELLSAISDISFTYQEARQTILADLDTIFHAMSDSILPIVSVKSIADAIQKILIDTVSDQISSTAQIAVHPSQIEALRQHLVGIGATNFNLVAEPSIPRLSAWVQVGARETCIDFQQVIDSVQMALNTYAQSNNEELQHG